MIGNVVLKMINPFTQFVVSSDGVVGLCYEHSSAEGIGVLNLIDEFLGKIQKESSATSDNGNEPDKGAGIDASAAEGNKGPEPIPQPIKLEWNISTEARNAVREACIEIDRYGTIYTCMLCGM